METTAKTQDDWIMTPVGDTGGGYSVGLVTLAAVVAGLDYVFSLWFPDAELLSANRVVFFGIVAWDLVCERGKYAWGIHILLAWFLVLLACIPFLFSVEQGWTGFCGPLRELSRLGGITAYMLFFHVNCRSSRTAGRVCLVLFFSAGVVAAYVLCSYLGLIGGKYVTWRGSVCLTRAAGAFDPNIIGLYFLPCFAFGPLLGLHAKSCSGVRKGSLLGLAICLALLAFLQTNSRAGTVAVSAALGTSLAARAYLASDTQLSSRIRSIAFVVVVVGTMAGLQLRYGVFNTITGVFRETMRGHAASSFEIRLLSYRYLTNDIAHGPSIIGNSAGYADFWAWTRVSKYPHCSLVDVYIKGGLLYLTIYLCFVGASIFRCSKATFLRGDLSRRAISAGFLAYLIGFLPLMMTLSIEGMKLPWAIIGCALGFTAIQPDLAPQSPQWQQNVAPAPSQRIRAGRLERPARSSPG